MQYIKNGHLIIDTGTRAEPQGNPMKLLEVESDGKEYQVKIYGN
jgi:hypothetical protein